MFDNDKAFQAYATEQTYICLLYTSGPPSANGHPGIHHVLARSIKDTFNRYKTMKGFQAVSYTHLDVYKRQDLTPGEAATFTIGEDMNFKDTKTVTWSATSSEGKDVYKRQDLVGPYELHDFFLYYFLRFGFRPAKIYMLAKKAFIDSELERCV